MTQIWTEGEVHEYSNGWFATVTYQRGNYAVLKEHQDPRMERPIGNFIAHADAPPDEDGYFPWCYADENADGEEIIYSNHTDAVVRCVQLHGESSQ